MGRLIDADALCKRLRKIYDGYMLDEGCCPIEFESLVDEQPTAYDTEKVIADIEEYYEEAERYGFASAISDIVEVVKMGGVT